MSKKTSRWRRRLLRCCVVLAVLSAGAAVGGYIYLRTVHPMANLPHWLTDCPIAHRGLHGEGAPENSLAAFRRAVEAGLPIELDVHVLTDGRVAVFHDDSLTRMTGDPRYISDCSSADLATLRLSSTDESIPLLEDVLACVDGNVGLLVELKNGSRKDRRLEKAVAACMDGYAGPWAVQSFNPFSLAWFAEHRPGVPRGQLSADFAKIEEQMEADLSAHERFLLKNHLLDGWSKPAFLAHHSGSLPSWVVALKRSRGVAVLAWTVRDKTERDRVTLYCDNIIAEGDWLGR